MAKSFPKIFAIGTKYILDIFNDEVEITEKVDGSQFVFGKVGGEVILRSKGADLFMDNPEKMFKRAIDYIATIKDKLPEDIIFYSEYLKSPHHNILTYERTPKNNLILFGVSTPSDEFIGDWRKYVDLLEGSPRDIGKLMKELSIDVESEEKEAIKDWLWSENRREVLGVAGKGFPEWYKKQLLENSFPE